MADDEQPRKPLSLREAKFVDAYTGEAFGNATQAIKLAGSPSTGHALQVAGSQTLHRPHVQAEIRERFAEIMTVDETVQHLADIIRDVAGDEVRTYDQRGNLVSVTRNRGDRIRAIDVMLTAQGVKKHDGHQVDVNVKAIIGVDLDKV